MTITTPPTQMPACAARPSRATGWVVAAIAVHLLVTSVASAASTCSETIERTRVTRLSHCVAQAIRELVDQGAEGPMHVIVEFDAEPVSLGILMATDCTLGAERLSAWLLNLPPPTLG
jgi:hypothetical protein